MPAYPLSRQTLLDTLHMTLEPLPYVYAAWQGGAAAFGRADEYSDIDLHIIAGDERVEDVFEIIEAALKTHSPISLNYRVPEPAWHGMSQTFYILEHAGPYLMLDVAIAKYNSTGPRFWEKEIHGNGVVMINKNNTFAPQPLDPAAHLEKMKTAVADLTARFAILQPLVEKELLRRQPMDAFHFYIGLTLRPLIQMLRTHHVPWHHDWGGRYLYRELPAEITARLEPLHFIRDAAELKTKHAEAVVWFNELAESLDWDIINSRL
ncbi:MAG: nucleotidyltransferase domain-containing protein [Anaerolineae bacterium]|nr:MAG: nucleotidyltransferase domain-containing protein [Anaerolineae bacterium]